MTNDCVYWGENRADELFIDVGCVLGKSFCDRENCNGYISMKREKSPPYPHPECTDPNETIDFCLMQGKHGCEHLVSEQGHQILYCGLKAWKAEEQHDSTPTPEEMKEYLKEMPKQ